MDDTPVYLVPVTFGFGPAALATAVARQLRRRYPDLPLVGVGNGIALDFLRSSGVFDDSLVDSPPGVLPDCVGRSGPAVTVFFADFDRLSAARVRGLRTVVVDPLYWMWDSDPADPASVDRYFALAFPGVAERVAQRGSHGETVRVVSQIVDLDTPVPGTRRAGTVLNLGGAVAPMGDNHLYLRTLVELVTQTLSPVDHLLVTCSSKAKEAICRGGPIPGATVSELPFGEMMSTLGRCARLFTLPGQSIMWEALRMRTPTVVLPGANYSQHRQFGAYRRFLAGIQYIGWDDLDGYGTLPPGLPEERGVALAIELGNRLSTDQSARGQLVKLMTDILSCGHSQAPTLRDGHPWPDFGGATQVADEIGALAREARLVSDG